MKANSGARFVFFEVLAFYLAFTCKDVVRCSFAGEKAAPFDVLPPKVNVLPPSQALPMFEAEPCIAELALAQALRDVFIPYELWPEIFSVCTPEASLSCVHVCRMWKKIIESECYAEKLCMLIVEDEANFDRLLLVLKPRTREDQKVLLQRLYEKKLVPSKLLLDLIVRLSMTVDVFPIVTELLRDTSLPVSKIYQEFFRRLSVDKALADPQVARHIRSLTPDHPNPTPQNFRPCLSPLRIFDQIIEAAFTTELSLFLQLYRQLKGAICLPEKDFPTLSSIGPLFPLIFPLSEMCDDNGRTIFPAFHFYLKLVEMQTSEEIMPKEKADKILGILELVEPMNEQSLEFLVPYLCPSFLKFWDQHHPEIGKPLITQFLSISERFKELNKVGYGEALISRASTVIHRAITSLTTVQSVPFFVYRPLLVKFISILEPEVIYDVSHVPFSGIEYPPCFMEDLCVLAIICPGSVHTFFTFLEPKQRSSLVSYSAELTKNLFASFEIL